MRVFVPHNKWECYLNGMYERDCPKMEGVNRCYGLLTAPPIFKETLEKMKIECPITMQVHLTNPTINQRAFLGRAACNFKFGYSDDYVRLTWNLLTLDEQNRANDVAQKFIDEYKQPTRCLSLF